MSKVNLPLLWTACSTDTCAATCENRKSWTTEITIDVCNVEDPPDAVIKRVLEMMLPIAYKDFIKWLEEERRGRANA